MKYGIKYIQHGKWTLTGVIHTDRGYEAWLDHAISWYVTNYTAAKAFDDINAAYKHISTCTIGLTTTYDPISGKPLDGWYYVVEELSL